MVLARIGDLDVASIYLPSGSSSDEAHLRKQRWMKDFAPHAKSLMRRRRSVLLGGDFNIARSERDIFHWKSNQSTSGFLPEEREWMDEIVGAGARDLVRDHFGGVEEPVTVVESWSGENARSWLANRLSAETPTPPEG